MSEESGDRKNGGGRNRAPITGQSTRAQEQQAGYPRGELTGIAATCPGRIPDAEGKMWYWNGGGRDRTPISAAWPGFRREGQQRLRNGGRVRQRNGSGRKEAKVVAWDRAPIVSQPKRESSKQVSVGKAHGNCSHMGELDARRRGGAAVLEMWCLNGEGRNRAPIAGQSTRVQQQQAELSVERAHGHCSLMVGPPPRRPMKVLEWWEG
ncbi:MAG: hypothetical protein M1840_001477 [Geoglossum simile]|nr:MAG: hypothetical protein M1840_001477 [Geoglossum simile]